ncbi:MAG: MATE family efflux transporter [Coriobacteriales bacterium]|nr:MATE family efflux transporter [Coriobacteriales bacterium]
MSAEKDAQYERMTSEPVSRLVVSLAIPAVVSMMITSVYSLVDTAFVGTLGTSASGAVGVVFGFMAILQAAGFMFGQGAGSILARALGERDLQKATVHATLGFVTAFVSGLMIAVGCGLQLDRVVYLLGSTPTIAPYARTYVFYILLAAPFMCSSFTLNNLLRYEGKAVLGTIGMAVGAALNILGDLVFMFGLDMGITGAGISTALGEFVGWCVLLSMFLRHKTSARISLRALAYAEPLYLVDIMATGFPSMLRQALNSVNTVMLNNCCMVYGDAAVAGMSIVSRVSFFAFSFALGIGQGFQPVTGFNYGARKFRRVREAFRFTSVAAEIVILLACVVLFVFAEPIVSIFRDDPAVLVVGTRALRLQAVALLALPVCVATEMLYQCTGKRLGATFLSGLRNGLLFLPLLLALSNLRGLAGIQEAQPLAYVLSLPLTIPFILAFFRRLPQDEE